ncbi:hypothetical protein MMC28_001233 [Mycoblastus sanguinarius]|nr:hypothetical protein [Mycoblastus sanguinarius]
MSATREPRKSVAFQESATMVDSNGEVTEINGTSEKASAQGHSAVSPDHSATKDAAVDEVTDLFKGLNKKKKSSKKSKESKDSEAAEEGGEPAPAADGEFDPTALKKKKKKKVAKPAEDEFEAKLAEAGVNENGEAADDTGAKTAPELEEMGGDMFQGTGIWSHNEEKPIVYDKLLERFFALLHSAHPDLLSSGTKSYVIPPPQCLREGNKKTIFANIPDICKRMKRSEEHVMQFIFAELGTSGSVDGSRRLVIKGRFLQKQIENVLRRYIGESPTFRLMTAY